MYHREGALIIHANMSSRRTGDSIPGEEGAVRKDWGGKISVALVYPNAYRLGMSNLGYQIIYSLLNEQEDVVCERIFLPGPPDGPGKVRSLESRRTLSDFEVVAVSLPYENDFLNLFSILHQARVPAFARERGKGHPLLVGGGLALTMNPEPLADVFDLIVIGEGEDTLLEFLDEYRSSRGADRKDVLKALARIEGIYVPSAYRRTVWGLEPFSGYPERVKRRHTVSLHRFPGFSQVVTPRMEFGRTVLIEPIRGCGRMCRFCAAGYHYLPPRNRSLSHISGIERARQAAARIGILGAALSDFPHLSELFELISRSRIKMSLSSIHGEDLERSDLDRLVEGQVKTLTLAPETGSEELRYSLNKTCSHRQYLDASERIVSAGVPHLRLYFLFGLPGETDMDLRAAGDLVSRVQSRRRKAARTVMGQLTVCLAPFVPKPATPFQWAAIEPAKELKRKRQVMVDSLKSVPGVRIRTGSIPAARLEAFLGLAPREVGEMLSVGSPAEVKKISLAQEVSWMNPGPDPDRAFPWEIVDSGVDRVFLWGEWEGSRKRRPSREDPGKFGGQAGRDRCRGLYPDCPDCGVCRE